MVLRSLAGEFARTTAGAWRAVAQVVDPQATPPRRSPEPAAGPDPAATVEAPPAVEVGPDQMLVPIDAWTRILEQVGNLHEAGQELADAKERAAKAETESAFLREQVRGLKAERGTRRRPAAPRDVEAPAATRVEPAPEAPPSAAVSDRRARAGERLRQARSVAGRWITPD